MGANHNRFLNSEFFYLMIVFRLIVEPQTATDGQFNLLFIYVSQLDVSA